LRLPFRHGVVARYGASIGTMYEICGRASVASSGNCVSAFNARKRDAYQVVTRKSNPMEQAARFREAARDVGADESDDALDRVMGKLDLRKKPEQDKTKQTDK
jgi:hypothetical protein